MATEEESIQFDLDVAHDDEKRLVDASKELERNVTQVEQELRRLNDNLSAMKNKDKIVLLSEWETTKSLIKRQSQNLYEMYQYRKDIKRNTQETAKKIKDLESSLKLAREKVPSRVVLQFKRRSPDAEH